MASGPVAGGDDDGLEVGRGPVEVVVDDDVVELVVGPDLGPGVPEAPLDVLRAVLASPPRGGGGARPRPGA